MEAEGNVGKILSLAVAVLLLACSDNANDDGGKALSEQTPPLKNSAQKSLADNKQPVVRAGASLWNQNEMGFVLHGYDPISYHEGNPIVGVDEFSLVWQDVKWKFSSQEHLDRFKGNPGRYAPALGGFCTFGVIIDKRLDGDPEVWAMSDNKPHLFLNEEVKAKFLQDENNWERVSSKWTALPTSPGPNQ